MNDSGASRVPPPVIWTNSWGIGSGGGCSGYPERGNPTNVAVRKEPFMAQITLDGNPINTVGELPAVGSQAPGFTLVDSELGEISLEDFRGKRVVLNIFPSLDTGVCANSVREFNKRAAGLENTQVLCVSADLPFAHGRFCAAEGIENVVTGSVFRSSFGDDYGVKVADGPLAGVMSRAVVIIDENGVVKYTQQVPEIKQDPNIDEALGAL